MKSTIEPKVISNSRFDRALMTGGIFLGAGFAGFFDGIVLHQVLQWHHMLTSVHPNNNLANFELNTFWDGLFHIGAFGLTIAGLFFLWRADRQGNLSTAPKSLIGSILIGAGAFDLTEGLINHQILGIHHVKSGPHQLAWDLGFLLLGAFLVFLGWLILRSENRSVVSES